MINKNVISELYTVATDCNMDPAMDPVDVLDEYH